MDAPIELKYWLEDPTSEKAIAEAKRVVDILKRAGAFAVRDPRVTEEDNNKFLDLLESYFEQPEEVKLKDARPDIHYQLGVTPNGVELPKCASDPSCQDMINKMPEEHRAHPPTQADNKWRFFHRVGPRPTETKFGELNAPAVIPAAFPNWAAVMDNWGSKLLSAGFTIAEMIAVGFGLPKNTLTDMMNCGPHLLAPTASDLNKHGKLDTVLAGFHNDLNFITIHGKSRYPGLDIWLRDGTKVPVVVPDGCLLMQAGQQIEYLTGGEVLAGWHEVVVNQRTLDVIERSRAAGKSLWRISSTLFSHINSDATLRVLVGSEEEKKAKLAKYPAILAGDQVNAELEAIKLNVSAANK
jgi:isopenicillin N synthase-like dioxygenase